MKHHIPSCFRFFRCIAGQCPDTCCAGWEIDLDEEILARYATVPGALGDRIREKLRTGDGYTGFSLENGRCPFLNNEKLCELILQLGEDALSVTCREHPRFLEEYGDLQETCLCVSCPEAARLLFSEPFSLTLTETAEAAPEEELDEKLLSDLLSFRSRLFDLLDEPLKECIPIIIEETCQMQAELDARCFGIVSDPSPVPLPELDGFLRVLGQMEFTDRRLPERLAALTGSYDLMTELTAGEAETRTLLKYFLYRYLLRAVWNGDLIDKVLLALCSAGAIGALSRVMDAPDPICAAAILYSREVEHSDGNLELLLGYLIGICC